MTEVETVASTESQNDAQVEATATGHREADVLSTAGQRRINLIWEATQATIALAVVASNMAGGLYFAFARVPTGDYPAVLSSSLFLVIGFYFSRTNHTAVGGVGPKNIDAYKGR
jgi:hypothetical protein